MTIGRSPGREPAVYIEAGYWPPAALTAQSDLPTPMCSRMLGRASSGSRSCCSRG